MRNEQEIQTPTFSKVVEVRWVFEFEGHSYYLLHLPGNPEIWMVSDSFYPDCEFWCEMHITEDGPEAFDYPSRFKHLVYRMEEFFDKHGFPKEGA